VNHFWTSVYIYVWNYARGPDSAQSKISGEGSHPHSLPWGRYPSGRRLKADSYHTHTHTQSAYRPLPAVRLSIVKTACECGCWPSGDWLNWNLLSGQTFSFSPQYDPLITRYQIVPPSPPTQWDLHLLYAPQASSWESTTVTADTYPLVYGERCDRLQSVICRDRACRQQTERSHSCVSSFDHGLQSCLTGHCLPATCMLGCSENQSLNPRNRTNLDFTFYFRTQLFCLWSHRTHALPGRGVRTWRTNCFLN
jgi:hypothetical protein